MERVEYDTEIDPSIREAQEEAERERELSARIRIEIERYAKENGRNADGEINSDKSVTSQKDEEPDPAKEKEEQELDEKQRRREEKEKKKQEKAEKNARRAAEGRRAFQSIFTGNILSAEWVRRMMPYMAGFAVLLMLYIANIFHLQRLHRNQQRLEDEIRELTIKAVGYSAERAQNTQRSAIVRRLEQKNIPLKEFPKPVKTIDSK